MKKKVICKNKETSLEEIIGHPNTEAYYEFSQTKGLTTMKIDKRLDYLDFKKYWIGWLLRI